MMIKWYRRNQKVLEKIMLVLLLAAILTAFLLARKASRGLEKYRQHAAAVSH